MGINHRTSFVLKILFKALFICGKASGGKKSIAAVLFAK